MTHALFLGTLSPFVGVSNMLSHAFMDRAFIGGAAIALASGVVGYFVVLRSQVFTGDALSHVAFTGSLAALAIGMDLRIGLFVSCVIVGLIIGALGRFGHANDVVIGNVFAWILGLGVFFLTVYTTEHSNGANGTASTNVLFGSIFGLTTQATAIAVVVGVVILLIMAAIARPLLFASLDEAVAATHGVPVRLLGVGFIGVVGLTAGEATQATGALLLLGLLAAPAGAARSLTNRPWRALWLSAGLSLLAMWLGLTLSYAFPSLPPSFCILSVAALSYLVSWLGPKCKGLMTRQPSTAPAVRLE